MENKDPIKTKTDKLAVRLKTGLISEKGLGFSLLSAEQLFKDANYRTLWIADCIAWAITKEFGYRGNEELAKEDVSGLQALETYYTELKNIDPYQYDLEVPQVELTSKEIREKLGRQELLNSDIHELVEKFAGTTIERKSKRLVDGDKWIEFGRWRHLCTVDWAATGRFSNRNQQPEYFYNFVFDKKESLDFLLSVMGGYFDCRPNSYYKLRGGTQQIIRALCWTPKPTTIELQDLCRIAGIDSNNVTMQKKYIASYLEEAEDAGFISAVKSEARKASDSGKKEYWYSIAKSRQLPKK